MDASSIPEVVTPAVTLYDHFLTALRQHATAAGGKPFFASHRALAAELQCSAGALPRLMQRAEDDGILIRRPYRNTHRLHLIDQARTAFPERVDAVIDHTPPAAPPTAVDPPPLAAPQQDAESGVIDQIPAHEVHVSKSVVVGCAQARVSTEEPAWRETGLSPKQIAVVAAAGVSADQFRAAVALKMAERADTPIGVVYDRIKAGLGVLTQAAAGEASDAAAGTGRRPPAHQRHGSAGSRAAPPPRPTIAQPAPAFASIAERPRLRLDLSHLCGERRVSHVT